MTPASGTIIADRFRLVRTLGEGGMGSVWLAQHLKLDVLCAVKLIQADSRGSEDVRRRFEREAKTAAQIRSPHVVQILDHGVWEDTPYIAMEFLEGEDLEQRIGRVHRLSPLETATVISQVARALSRAHAAGLVHRDLKPANIFLARDDDREIVKVLDFGIAKEVTPSVASTTKTGSLLGTPVYMSPEQAQGIRAVDHRSDLWSLAVVVYECLTGYLPFVSEAFGDLLLKIMTQPLPVPSQFAEVPAGFDAWWARAAERDPDKRFQSAKDLAETLLVALGLAPGATELLTGISGSFRLDVVSSPSFPPGVLPAPERISVPPLERRSFPTPEPLSDRSFDDAASSAKTLPAHESHMGLFSVPPSPSSGEGPASLPIVMPAGVSAPLGAASPDARPHYPTAGPVSTSLKPGSLRSAPTKTITRVAAVVLGMGVAATGAFLLLRGSSAPQPGADRDSAGATARPDDKGSPGEQPPAVTPASPGATPPAVPTEAAPLATATPSAALAVGAAGTAGAHRPSGTAASATAGVPPRPSGTAKTPAPTPTGSTAPTTPNTKKRDPKDFGI
ncbi:serine/threonine-protein kinase [Chondromyces apiculatus]|uniref:Putative serine/threonine-protein kinase pknH n=1 Tax=Chondromyces apiculatus DSM 436 TaxID=1192034 RepID=A0A017TDE5_9BACT|nr:serine/threonine-protein kinase [Chondromyces apiculatus]EYF06942.1 putative serine/threonine-protein kinase pknH [Chondromyces apiculatus DSM 436]